MAKRQTAFLPVAQSGVGCGCSHHGVFATSKPRLLFEKPGFGSDASPIRGYDLSLDGQRFLMVKDKQRKPTPVTELVLIQNWYEEVKRMLPVR